MPEPEPPIVLDADGEPIRKGQYRTCPICGLMFRDPLQDADPSIVGVLVTGRLGEPPRVERSKGWRLLMDEHERHLRDHIDTHTMLEALEVIVRLQRQLGLRRPTWPPTRPAAAR